METGNSIGSNVAIVTINGCETPQVGNASKPFSDIMTAIDSGARNLLIYPGTYEGAKIYGDVNLTGIGQVTIRYLNVEVGKVILDNLTINYLEDSGDVTATNCDFIGSPSIVAYGTLNLFDCRLRSTNNAISASSHSNLNISGCQFTSTNTKTFVTTLPGGGYGSWEFSQCTFNIIDPHPIDPEVISARQLVNLNYFDSVVNTTSTTNTLSQVLSIVNTDVQDYAANIRINNVSLNGTNYYQTLMLELSILEQFVRQSNNISYDSTIDPRRGFTIDVNGHIYSHAITSHNGLSTSSISTPNGILTIGNSNQTDTTIIIENDTTILSPLSVNVIDPTSPSLTITKPIEVNGISIGHEPGLISLTGTNILQIGGANNSIVVPGTLTVAGHRVEATLIGPDTALVTLNGSDTTGRVGNAEFPFSTIEGALSVASNIILAPGSYPQSVTISSNASISSWDSQNTDIGHVTVNSATVTFSDVIINSLSVSGTVNAVDCTIETVNGTGSLTLKRCTTGTISYNGAVDIFTSNIGNISGTGSWTVDGCSISVTGSGDVVVVNNSNGSVSVTNSSMVVGSVSNPGTLTVVSATTDAIVTNVNLVGSSVFSSVNTGVTPSNSYNRVASGVVMDSKPVYSYGLIMDKDRLYTANISATGNVGISGVLNTNTIEAITGSDVTVDGTLHVTGTLNTNTINPLSGSTTITLGTSSDTIDILGNLYTSSETIGTTGVSGGTGSLTIYGSNNTGSSLTVDGSESITGDLIVNGSETITGNLLVNASETITGDLTVNGSETIGTTNTNAGSLTIYGSGNTGSSLTVNGSESITGDLTVEGTLNTNTINPVLGSTTITLGTSSDTIDIPGIVSISSLTVNGKAISPTMFENTAALVSSVAANGSGQLGNWNDPYPTIDGAVNAGATTILILPGSYGNLTISSTNLTLIGITDPRTTDVVIGNLTWNTGTLNLSNLNISGKLIVNNGNVVVERCNIGSVSFYAGSIEFNDCILGPIDDYSTSGYISANRSSMNISITAITVNGSTQAIYNPVVTSGITTASTTVWRFSHCTIVVSPGTTAPSSSFELFQARYGVSVYLTSCSFEYLGEPPSGITVTIVDTSSTSPAGNVSIIDFVATGSGYTIASGVVPSTGLVRTVDNLSTSATLSYDSGFQVDGTGNLYTPSEIIGTTGTNIGSLTIYGSSNTGPSLTVDGSETITGNLTVDGSVTIGTSGTTGSLTVDGSETITGNLTVDGSVTIGTSGATGSLTVDCSETIMKNLTVNGTEAITGDLSVGGTVTLSSLTSTNILATDSTGNIVAGVLPSYIFAPSYGAFTFTTNYNQTILVVTQIVATNDISGFGSAITISTPGYYLVNSSVQYGETNSPLSITQPNTNNELSFSTGNGYNASGSMIFNVNNTNDNTLVISGNTFTSVAGTITVIKIA